MAARYFRAGDRPTYRLRAVVLRRQGRPSRGRTDRPARAAREVRVVQGRARESRPFPRQHQGLPAARARRAESLRGRPLPLAGAGARALRRVGVRSRGRDRRLQGLGGAVQRADGEDQLPLHQRGRPAARGDGTAAPRLRPLRRRSQPMTPRLLMLLAALAATTKDSACTTEPEAASGVNKANVTVATGPTGLTVEQMNVSRRVIEDNKPGAVKHLYVISAMSGQVLLYSTVHGKVTSSGKRLSPLTTTTGTSWCMTVAVRGHEICTSEMLQDDGTYGSSVDYVYWWDTKGVYHQLYVTGGEIVVITSQPVNVPHVVINLNSARDVAASG